MALKLYGLPISICTSRAMVCLHEKGVDFELVPVNLFGGEHKQPPFLAKNPFAKIPVLEDGDLTLFGLTAFLCATESRAITSYIAEKFKETGTDLIRHQNLNEAASVKVWLEVESHHFDPAISPIIFEYLVAPLLGKTPDQAVIDANLEKLEKVLDVYESKLSSTKYLAGDFFSLADLHHHAYTHFLMKTPWASLINDRPHVKAWWEDISSRPATKKVAEGMTIAEKK
ncbi:Glutathione S-transferase F13 [Morella rubra]|uniref:glutathione transferase n=1 Tax=Morella rubra TaxID=262757 RepID=A0A6A1URX9_9ROSI|nr:Glutathione S-transferase F13 [Morella rubra]